MRLSKNVCIYATAAAAAIFVVVFSSVSGRLQIRQMETTLARNNVSVALGKDRRLTVFFRCDDTQSHVAATALKEYLRDADVVSFDFWILPPVTDTGLSSILSIKGYRSIIIDSPLVVGESVRSPVSSGIIADTMHIHSRAASCAGVVNMCLIARAKYVSVVGLGITDSCLLKLASINTIDVLDVRDTLVTSQGVGDATNIRQDMRIISDSIASSSK